MGILPGTGAGANLASEKNRKAALSQATGHARLQQKPPIFGTVIEQKTALNENGFKTLQVRVEFDARGSDVTRGKETNWYGLGYAPDVLVHIFGMDLVGRRCKLEYNTADANTGVIYLVHNRFFELDLELAATLPSIGGAVLAPPGSSTT